MLPENFKIILKQEDIEEKGKLIEKFIKRVEEKIYVKKEFFKKIPLGIIKNNEIKELCKIEENKNYILIVLESPHKSEYKIEKEEIKVIAPAKGETGDNILKNEEIIKEIVDDLKQLENKENYEIIIINPVPYQTSLYHLYERSEEETKEYKMNQRIKKFVWREIWDLKECKDEFMKNIKKINPVYTFNCCTYAFKKRIGEIIKEELKTNDIYELYHPSHDGFTDELKHIKKYMDKKRSE